MVDAVSSSFLALVGGIIGSIFGVLLNDLGSGAVLGAIVVGVGCIVHLLRAKNGKFQFIVETATQATVGFA